MYASHEQTEVLLACVLRIQDIHDLPFVHNGNSIRERQDFIELLRDQQHSRPFIALFDDLVMDIFDRTHVQATRGL